MFAATLGLYVLVAGSCGALPTDDRTHRPPGAFESTRPPSPAKTLSDARPPRVSQEESFHFAVKGDWGAGTPAQAAVTAQMCARRAENPYLDVVTTGDNFYRPDGVATEANYHRPEDCLIGHPGHRWRAVWGNHDVEGNATGQVLGAERYYTWSAGPAQFFHLDSNRPHASQTAWLDRELAASKARWKIAVFHHPPFSAGTHESNIPVRRAWVPLFERHGVSLVLSGHNHLYEHSALKGIHYVVSGGGGAGLYRCERSEVWLLKCEPRHHSLSVTVDENAVRVTAIDSAGGVLDDFKF